MHPDGVRQSVQARDPQFKITMETVSFRKPCKSPLGKNPQHPEETGRRSPRDLEGGLVFPASTLVVVHDLYVTGSLHRLSSFKLMLPFF